MPANRELKGAKRAGASVGGQFAPNWSGKAGITGPAAPPVAFPWDSPHAEELALDACPDCGAPLFDLDGVCADCEQAAYDRALQSPPPADVLDRAYAQDDADAAAAISATAPTVSSFPLPPELEKTISGMAKAVVDGDAATAADLRAQLTDHIARLPVQAAPASFDTDPIDPTELPHAPGIYIITGPDASYVGLAEDVHQRFYNRDYGHLTENNHCRSRHIIDTGEYEIRILPAPETGEGREADKYAISEAEIRAYAQLVAAGHYPNNAVATLGRVGSGSVIPIVTCDLTTGEYTFYESTMAANRDTGSTAIAAALHGYQRIGAGRVVRWATFAEQERLLDKTDRRGKLTGKAVTDALSRAPRSVERTERDHGRGPAFSWNGGLLADDDIAALRPYVRGDYNKDRPGSGFNGVRTPDGAGAKWEARIRTGPNSKEAIVRTFTDAREAAIFRETYIAEHGLQPYNTGKGGSNAAALNAALGTDRFPGWDSAPARIPGPATPEQNAA